MRVLICGGRNYDDAKHDFAMRLLMMNLIKTHGEIVIIHGCASGADTWAEIHAKDMKQKFIGYRAEWNKYGPKAGPLRNQRMLVEGEPNLVIAFPGGRGTSDMVRRAHKAGVKVIEPCKTARVNRPDSPGQTKEEVE